jgi:CDGSH-type Zn-finger protein
LEKADIERQDQTKEKPKISVLPNGPYYLLNEMEPKVVENLQNSKGEPLSTVSGVALCRCGASNNKPFCDGTHGTIGFSSENKTAADDSEHMIRNKRKTILAEK